MENSPVARRSKILTKLGEHQSLCPAPSRGRFCLDRGKMNVCDGEAGRNNRGGVFGQCHFRSLRAGFEHLHDSGRQGAGNGALAVRVDCPPLNSFLAGIPHEIANTVIDSTRRRAPGSDGEGA